MTVEGEVRVSVDGEKGVFVEGDWAEGGVGTGGACVKGECFVTVERGGRVSVEGERAVSVEGEVLCL